MEKRNEKNFNLFHRLMLMFQDRETDGSRGGEEMLHADARALFVFQTNSRNACRVRKWQHSTCWRMHNVMDGK